MALPAQSENIPNTILLIQKSRNVGQLETPLPKNGVSSSTLQNVVSTRGKNQSANRVEVILPDLNTAFLVRSLNKINKYNKYNQSNNINNSKLLTQSGGAPVNINTLVNGGSNSLLRNVQINKSIALTFTDVNYLKVAST